MVVKNEPTTHPVSKNKRLIPRKIMFLEKNLQSIILCFYSGT